MRVLIDILHPAHVHFFRNFYAEMTDRGHQVHFTARVKECSVELLERYDVPHQVISVQRHGAIGLAREMLERTYRLLGVIRSFRPDVLTGIMGPSITLAGRLSGVPAVVFYDTEFAKQTNWFAYPLAHSVCTPDCYRDRVRGRHVTYSGYHELAYLHPKRFSADPKRLEAFGLAENEAFSMVRFVSWKAIHDVREIGLTVSQKRRIVESLSARGRVVISSEAALPEDLEPLRLKGPSEDIHHVLAHAELIVGESATMSSEAAVLGTPAVFIATSDRGYTDDQERRYGHVRYFTEGQFEQALQAMHQIYQQGPKAMGATAREKLLAEKIDVTSWMVEYFEREFA